MVVRSKDWGWAVPNIFPENYLLPTGMGYAYYKHDGLHYPIQSNIHWPAQNHFPNISKQHPYPSLSFVPLWFKTKTTPETP